jgi:hypothetical protein
MTHQARQTLIWPQEFTDKLGEQKQIKQLQNKQANWNQIVFSSSWTPCAGLAHLPLPIWHLLELWSSWSVY